MGANPIRLDKVGTPQLPLFGPCPSLAAAEYDVRMGQLLERSGADAVVVYGDREHSANLVHCCGLDPRFEEAPLSSPRINDRCWSATKASPTRLYFR